MKKIIFSTIITFLGATLATGAEYAGPENSAKGSSTLWNNYCIGDANSPQTPAPNYSNKQVKDAAAILSRVADLSFYYYSGPLRAYSLRSKGPNPTGNGIPTGTTNSAHNFLVILCGEFRDRPTMVEAKINWVLNLFKLPIDNQKPIDYKRNVWSQVSAHSYAPYLSYSLELYNAQRAEVKEFQYGSYTLEEPVQAQTVCETKYIFGEVIAKSKAAKKNKWEDIEIFPGLKKHKSGLEKFASKNCTDDDLNYFYDFRGDSNFKPNSPESNGMIWYSSSLTTQCLSTTKKKPEAKGGIDDNMCAQYFKKPFTSRWNAARAGLSTWIFRSKQHDPVFSAEGQSVVMLPQVAKFDSPFPFKIGSRKLADFLDGWNHRSDWSKKDIGFNDYVNLGGGSMDTEKMNLAYERLRDAVNRHTDWYSSGYDDGMGTVRDQAYSPFVASSYEMSASNGFTAPGATIQSPSDGRKHWMFVFKVHKDKWYNSRSLQNGVPVDFDTMWFDETTFGTNHLARSERAWDRLGTALEKELDSILYLHNITTDGLVQKD